jgi:hypothetical protein
MGSHQTTITSVLQTVPSWMGVALGHFSENVTLANVALVASIVYSVVNVWYILRRKREPGQSTGA